MLSSAASLPAPGTSQGLAWRAQWRQEVGTSQELEEHPIPVMRGTGGRFFWEPLQSLRPTFPIKPLRAGTAAAGLCPPTIATQSTKLAPVSGAGASTLTLLLRTQEKQPSWNHTQMGAPEQV